MNGLRVGILAGAVVMGGLIIANAFPTTKAPGPSSSPSASPSVTPSTSPSASPSASPSGTGRQCGSPNGLLIAVENAADPHQVVAGPVAAKLKNAGYAFASPTDVSNAVSVIPKTIVFYRAASDKQAATCMQQNFFPHALVKPMSAGGTAAHPAFSQTARLAVFLGQDQLSQ